jgi:uncharacterized protein (TIGR02271 family)
MRWNKDSLREGMFVTSTAGEKIGKVIRCDDETFVVEKGILFPKDYELRYDHITEVSDGKVRYALADFMQREGRTEEAEAIRSAPGPAARGAAATGATTAALDEERQRRANAAAAETSRLREAEAMRARTAAEEQRARTAAEDARARAARTSGEAEKEVRIPLMNEELEVEKFARESGHVRVHKGVKTEEKHFTVPVRREEVVIEHVARPGHEPLAASDAAFREETVDIALHEEEIRVSKRPFLREEVVVRTVAHSVEKEGTATLRHEEAEVEDTRARRGAEPPSGPGFSAPGRR